MGPDFKELEEMIAADARRIYSETVLDHAQHPRNLGEIPSADGYGTVTGPCGDTMEIFLRVNGDRIMNAGFWTDGCGTSVASGSMVTELAKGKSLAEARRITPKVVLESLGGLPEESEHCALLAASTLHEAIKDYMTLKKEPWKKGYRKR